MFWDVLELGTSLCQLALYTVDWHFLYWVLSDEKLPFNISLMELWLFVFWTFRPSKFDFSPFLPGPCRNWPNCCGTVPHGFVAGGGEMGGQTDGNAPKVCGRREICGGEDEHATVGKPLEPAAVQSGAEPVPVGHGEPGGTDAPAERPIGTIQQGEGQGSARSMDPREKLGNRNSNKSDQFSQFKPFPNSHHSPCSHRFSATSDSNCALRWKSCATTTTKDCASCWQPRNGCAESKTRNGSRNCSRALSAGTHAGSSPCMNSPNRCSKG